MVVLGNISDNHYNFTPHDRETKFGTIYDAKTFKVYFDGKEKDYFRTLFGAATLTRHFNPNTYLALQFSTYSTQEHETYDIQGQYWLNEATSQEQMGVGTYLEHARNRLRARVMNTGLRFRTKLTGHTLQAGFNWTRETIHATLWGTHSPTTPPHCVSSIVYDQSQTSALHASHSLHKTLGAFVQKQDYSILPMACDSATGIGTRNLSYRHAYQ